MHRRLSVSAISTYQWSLEDDLAFYERESITNVGISVAKLERFGWDEGVRRVVDAGLRVTNLIGLGPFVLDDASQWTAQRTRLGRALDAAATLNAECLIFTTGPAGKLTWEQAADALELALGPVVHDAASRGIPFALEHTNSLRVDVGFVHTLRDIVDLARRLGSGVCMEINACWAERDLAATVANAIDTLRLVQVSDFKVGTMRTSDRSVPGDGDIPIERIMHTTIAAGYSGCFDLELVGPAIEDAGYASAIRRSLAWLDDSCARLGI